MSWAKDSQGWGTEADGLYAKCLQYLNWGEVRGRELIKDTESYRDQIPQLDNGSNEPSRRNLRHFRFPFLRQLGGCETHRS